MYTFKQHKDGTISAYIDGSFQCNLAWSMSKMIRVFNS